MIRAVVAEFQFEGFAAESEAAELMAEADAEDGDATKEFLNIFDGVADGLWIAGAIGKKNAVWLEIENVLSAEFARGRPRLRSGDRPAAAVCFA